MISKLLFVSVSSMICELEEILVKLYVVRSDKCVSRGRSDPRAGARSSPVRGHTPHTSPAAAGKLRHHNQCQKNCKYQVLLLSIVLLLIEVSLRKMEKDSVRDVSQCPDNQTS